MKTSILAFIMGLIIITSCNNSEKKNNNKSDEDRKVENTENLKLRVYYFHTTRRCPTCNSIETNVKDVLDNNFKNELTNGIINFQSLNIDEKNNEKIAEKYKVYGSALHFIKIDKNNEKDFDLTDYAFSNSKSNTEKFKKEIKDTIAFYLK